MAIWVKPTKNEKFPEGKKIFFIQPETLLTKLSLSFGPEKKNNFCQIKFLGEEKIFLFVLESFHFFVCAGLTQIDTCVFQCNGARIYINSDYLDL